MFIRILVTGIIFFIAATPVWAIDQEKLEQLRFLLAQTEPIDWDDTSFDDTTLIDGFSTLYAEAINENKEGLRKAVIWAMGETGLIEFESTLISALDYDPDLACVAIRKIPSEEGIAQIIIRLDYDDVFVREAAAGALGHFDYYSDFPGARDAALVALNNRLLIETEGWIIEDIMEAIDRIMQQG